MITIVMAGEPVGKGRPRFVRKTGRAYTPDKTARFEERLAYAAQIEMAGRPLLAGPIRLICRIFMSVPASKPAKWKAAALAGLIRPTKKPDWENVAKMTDACNKVVWVDDCQVVESIVTKWYSEQPRLELRVRELAIAQAPVKNFDLFA